MLRAVFQASLLCALLAACSTSYEARQPALNAELSKSADAIGTPISDADIAAWNIDVAPDGHGLPAGSGDVAMGGRIFAARCATCHGAKGEGLIGDQLIGGRGTLTSANPKRTVGSYWPYATTLFDYIRRAMPYNAPQSLSADEVYAVSAWILNQNGIVPDDARLDAHSLAAVHMPNRDGFVSDPRPGKL
ncbi:cytochrome c [Burkholderia sp. Ac-20365]|uniref:c-type cytochrome n=1 Tax=Burkholderia sp. Ac-20365 TaxID=2703897 RepID=UPI00197B8A67|nr:cytochrome c [Burkholderia sp. Ac-20365]MBN3762037.1 cytochrome c [Burkholderia sp. Ac-20365]